MLGIDIFLALSLLTGLLEQQFPKILPYAYQAAGAFGVVQMVMARDFLIPLQAAEDTRFWYSISLTAVAAVNVLALNVYLGFIRHRATMARIFSSAITIPVALVFVTFLTLYTNGTSTLELPQSLLLLIVATAIGDGLAAVFFLKFSGLRRGTHTREESERGVVYPNEAASSEIPNPSASPQLRPYRPTLTQQGTATFPRTKPSAARPPYRFPHLKRARREVNYSDEDQDT